jgi:hypothetical protein
MKGLTTSQLPVLPSGLLNDSNREATPSNVPGIMNFLSKLRMLLTGGMNRIDAMMHTSAQMQPIMKLLTKANGLLNPLSVQNAATMYKPPLTEAVSMPGSVLEDVEFVIVHV